MISHHCRPALFFAAALLAAVPSFAAESRLDAGSAVRPNIVYILADDLGWGDISCHGGKTPTPHIDRLFTEGVELEHCMAWCVCSPTRAMLLTGRHPFRVGTGPEVGGELSADETTIAEIFRAAGYRTGVFGKWHNGEDPDTPEFRTAYQEAWKDRPLKGFAGGLGANTHGFDEAWIYYGGGADFFTRRTVQGRGPVSWWHNREFRGSDAGYTDDLVTDRACEFIAASAGKPFLCYVPFHIVHAPLQAKDEDLAAVDPAITDPEARVYAAMLRSLDANVARILDTLDRQGLRNDTIVVFTSDNGATVAGSSRPLRGSKHTIYEGGVRMPSAIHWPRGGLEGRPWKGLMSGMDMLPTLAALAGVPLPTTCPLDGRDVSTALRDNKPSPVESVYWTWHGQDALRTDRWKLHRFFDRVELYDIQADPGEAFNVADAHEDVVAGLQAKMDTWANSLSAALSHRPPAFDAPPAPAGDVLEITATVSDRAQPKNTLAVQFAFNGVTLQATDHVEYDVLVMPGSLHKGFFYSPGIGGERPRICFKKGDGIDQFGREQVNGPPPRGGPGVWEHRVIGLCSFAPGGKSIQSMVFSSATPGTYTIRLDNLRIRHADGSTTPIWTDRSHTRFKPITDGQAFTNIRVRTVAADAP